MRDDHIPGKNVFTWSENILPGPVLLHQRGLQRVPRQQFHHGQESLPRDEVERRFSFYSRVWCWQGLREHPEKSQGRHLRNSNSSGEAWGGFAWENGGDDDHGEDDLTAASHTCVYHMSAVISEHCTGWQHTHHNKNPHDATAPARNQQHVASGVVISLCLRVSEAVVSYRFWDAENIMTVVQTAAHAGFCENILCDLAENGQVHS